MCFRPNSGTLEEVPDSLLLKLLEASIKGCSDNDKIRVNTVRALGNFLLLVSADLMANEKFREATMRAIDSLVKNSTSGSNMKVSNHLSRSKRLLMFVSEQVRWNSCYALRNLLKNSDIYSSSKTWQVGFLTLFLKTSDLRFQQNCFFSVLCIKL